MIKRTKFTDPKLSNSSQILFIIGLQQMTLKLIIDDLF